jgi:hypothetical protein
MESAVPYEEGEALSTDESKPRVIPVVSADPEHIFKCFSG